MAASLRSAARCTGTCGVKPRRCSRYDVPRSVYRTWNSRPISTVTRASVHRWSSPQPQAAGPHLSLWQTRPDLVAYVFVPDRPTIVTNNSSAAVAACLARHHLDAFVRKIVGRDDPDPALMKPSPYRVRIAVGSLQAEPEHCVFIGAP